MTPHPKLSSVASRRGMALLAFVPAIVVLLVLMVAFVGITVDSTKWTQRRVDLFESRIAAETATQLAVEEIWTDWEDATAGLDVRVGTFRQFLQNYGIPSETGVATPVGVEILPRLGLPVDGQGEAVIDGVVVEGVRVYRFDELRRTRLEFETTAVTRRGNGTAVSADTRRTIQDVFVVEPPPFEGLDYALLANNINCVMCHTTIDNVDRFYNTDPAAMGTFAKVKAGSIETFQIRADPESTIAGSLYLGGDARDEHGGQVSDWTSLSLDGYEFDASANLMQDVAGEMTQVDLVAADNSNPMPGSNLYLDYFAHEGDADRYQVDGELPDEFPAPFPDDGGFDPTTFAETPGGAENRVVDDNEFWSTVAGLEGRAGGGSISVVPMGDRVDSAGALASLKAGSDSLGSVTDGNVFMHGTEDNPVRLDGDLAIAGDLIISGHVEGTGNLSVRGNIYVVGDLEYADREASGHRDYGVSDSGSANLLTLASGKNILVGDPYHPAFGAGPPANGEETGSWNFTMEEMGLFNRMEWMRTQPTLPGEPYQEIVGYNEVQQEIFQTVSSNVEQPTYEYQLTGNQIEQPIYNSVQTGTQEVPVYTTVHHPADPPEPYGSPWTEQVQTGTQTVPVYENVQVGTQMVDEYTWVQTGTETVTVTSQQSFSPPQYETIQVPIYEWVTPQHTNAAYRGPDYLPRYYSFREDTKVPIYNKEGHYDPVSELWIAPERAGEWDEGKLTFADPTDTSDEILYNADGSSKAAISTLTPTSEWIDDDLLRSIIEERMHARDSDEPLAVDAWLYSSNSVFGVAPNEAADGTTGKMRVNGAVIAADVGLLAPNDLRINYDERGQRNLNVLSTTSLEIQRHLWVSSSHERQAAPGGTL